MTPHVVLITSFTGKIKSPFSSQYKVEFLHTPVLLEEVLSFIPPRADSVIDFTLGGGGHAEAILNQFSSLHYYGIDRDEDAVTITANKLNAFENRLTIIHESFSNAIDKLRDMQTQTDFILADLGVSSYQIDHRERGFSFRSDAPLDMRMDQRSPKTAAHIVNEYSENDLTYLLKRYGEETFAKRIARAISQKRATTPFTSTWQLADCIREGIPKKFQFGKIHPATKSFQAIRIEVNEELKELETLLDNALSLLSKSGRIAVISFHSLEDRIVKNKFKKWEDPCECPKNIPYCICNETSEGQLVTRKVVTPGSEELTANPRSRSAKLRVFQKK